MKEIDQYVTRFCLPYTTQMKQLTKPLLKHFAIDTFLAYRFDQDGNYSLLSNAPHNTEFWHEQEYYRTNSFCSAPSLFTNSAYLISSIKDPALEHEKSQMKIHCAMDHEYLVLRKPSPDVALGFCFASSIPHNQIKTLYHHTPYIFDQFIDYFLEASKPFRAKSIENSVSILPYRGKAFYAGTKYIEELTNLDKKNRLFLNDLIPKAAKLTDAERLCIEMYLDGLTAAESAEKIKRSRRTVEAHFENIRSKLGISSKRALIALYKQK